MQLFWANLRRIALTKYHITSQVYSAEQTTIWPCLSLVSCLKDFYQPNKKPNNSNNTFFKSFNHTFVDLYKHGLVLCSATLGCVATSSEQNIFSSLIFVVPATPFFMFFSSCRWGRGSKDKSKDKHVMSSIRIADWSANWECRCHASKSSWVKCLGDYDSLEQYILDALIRQRPLSNPFKSEFGGTIIKSRNIQCK